MILSDLSLIGWPLAAALVLLGLHVYLGLHVVMRGVIFVDLALAQVAAFGTALGVIIGWEADAYQSYLLALGCTFLGALLFSFFRSKRKSIPQEAIIGITYVIAAAAMILLFSKSPHGGEEINHLLVGSILFVTPETVWMTTVLYLILGLIHWRWRKQFWAVSLLYSNDNAGKNEKTTNWHWDLFFYVTFGLVVTNSVKIAGVLLVFSFLIIPSIAAAMFVTTIRNRLIFGWIFGLIASVGGMVASLFLDLPAGAALVVTFGLLLILTAVTGKLTRT